MKTKVYELRKLGFKVKIIHYRARVSDKEALENGGTVSYYHRSEFDNPNNIYSKGGLTKVFVKTPDGVELENEANCHFNDSYNRKLGVNIALGRLFKENKLKTP